MAQRSKIPGIAGRKSTAPKKSIKTPIEEIPPFHIMDKKDLEKELSRIETEFGMAPEEFHKAWKEGKVHGHEAMKLSYYYEFYKDEYEQETGIYWRVYKRFKEDCINHQLLFLHLSPIF